MFLRHARWLHCYWAHRVYKADSTTVQSTYHPLGRDRKIVENARICKYYRNDMNTVYRDSERVERVWHLKWNRQNLAAKVIENKPF
jgi:hypothetical protein